MNEENKLNQKIKKDIAETVPLTEEEIKKNAKKKKKKRLIIAILIVSVLAAISYVISYRPEIIEGIVSNFRKTEKIPTYRMYTDQIVSYVFPPSNYGLDVTTDEWYMQLDRSVHYKNGGLSVMVLEEEMNDYNDAVSFFVEYFETIVAGDVDTYNSYFSDEYYDIYEPYSLFAPQMIYDIEVEQLTETINSDGTTDWTFNVKYKIYKNDGTFRNDIPSDASKTLYYELSTDKNGNVLIDYITYYR